MAVRRRKEFFEEVLKHIPKISKKNGHFLDEDEMKEEMLFESVVAASLIDDDEAFAALLDRFPSVNEPCVTLTYALPGILSFKPPLAAIPIFFGAIKCFRLLVMMSFDHDASDGKHHKMSHFAACGGNMDICRELTDLGLTFEEVDDHGNTPAHYAVMLGHEEIIQWLWTRGVRMNEGNENKETPLMLAALMGRESICHMFVDLFRSNKTLWKEVGPSSNRTLINYACYSGNLALVKYLLSERYPPQYCHDGFPPLVYACKMGNLQLVKLLCEVIPLKDINKSNRKFTPLISAITSKNIDVAEYLISKGADINVTTSDGFTTLDAAAIINNVEFLKRLISLGIAPWMVQKCVGYSIHHSCELSIIQFLFERYIEISEGIMDDEWKAFARGAVVANRIDVIEYMATYDRSIGNVDIKAKQRGDVSKIIAPFIETFHKCKIPLASLSLSIHDSLGMWYRPRYWVRMLTNKAPAVVWAATDPGIQQLLPLFENEYHITPEAVLSKDLSAIMAMIYTKDPGQRAKAYVVPNTVKEIQDKLFARTEFEEIQFESGSIVRTFGEYAFSEPSLCSIIIPKSVEVIGYRCFYKCTALTSVTFEEGTNLSTIGSDAFVSTKLKNIHIPKSVETLEWGCFRKCRELESITFEEGSKIETFTGGFDNCGVTRLIIPKSVVRLGKQCFAGCKMDYIGFEEGSLLKDVGSGFMDAEIGELEIPAGLEYLDYDSFSGCRLGNVTIDPRNKSIKWHKSFFVSGTDMCRYHTVPDVEQLIIPNYVTTLPSYCFVDSDIREIIFEKESLITELPLYCFSRCKNMKFIQIPRSVEIIRRDCFAADSSGGLERIEFEDGSRLREIHERAFYCAPITEIRIPASVRVLKRYCFGWCKALKSVVFEEGSQLEDVSSLAFNGVDNVTLPPGVEYRDEPQPTHFLNYI